MHNGGIGNIFKVSYAATLKAQMAHAPIKPLTKEDQTLAENLKSHETVEPELVAATTHLEQFAQTHLTKATPREKLPHGVKRVVRDS